MNHWILRSERMERAIEYVEHADGIADISMSWWNSTSLLLLFSDGRAVIRFDIPESESALDIAQFVLDELCNYKAMDIIGLDLARKSLATLKRIVETTYTPEPDQNSE